MKHMMGTVLIAGFLVVTADLEAAQRRFDRVKSMDGPRAPVALTSGSQLIAVDDFGSPPSAPALGPAVQPPVYESGAVPPAPLPPVTSPAPPSVLPLPEAAPPGVPGSVTAGGPPVILAPAPVVFPNVRYKDRRHIAPCAVPMYVAVLDPCERRDCRSCGPPKCVLVQICVPPGMPKITCRHDGTKVRYDYGKYAVNITSRHGVVVVNYDR